MQQQINNVNSGWGIETFIHKLESVYQQYLQGLLVDPAFWWLLGAFFLLGFIFALFLKRRAKVVKVVRDGGGQALVSHGALHDLVNLTCVKLGTPSKPKIIFKPRRNSLDLTVRLKLYEAQPLSEIRNILHDNLVKALEQTHGINIGKVDVIVVGFKKGGPTSEYSSTKASNFNNEEPSPTSYSDTSEELNDLDQTSSSSDNLIDTEESESPKKKQSFFGWGSSAKKKKQSDKSTNEPKVDES